MLYGSEIINGEKIGYLKFLISNRTINLTASETKELEDKINLWKIEHKFNERSK